MKSKKLFAILTLVAFMMTLVPAFAFAAVGTYSSYGSTVTVVDESIDIYDDTDAEYAQITLTFKGTGFTNGNTVYFYAKSNNDDLVGYVAGTSSATSGKAINANTISRGNGQMFEVVTDSKGKAYFFVNSNTPGEFEIGFYDGPADLEAYPDSRLIGGKKVEVTVELTGDAQLQLVAESADFIKRNLIDSSSPYEVDLTTAGKLAADLTSVNVYEVAKIEFGDEITLIATVLDAIGDPVEDEVVVFKKSFNGGSFVTIDEVETDDDGIAELDVEETKTGQYSYQAVLKSDKTIKTYNMGKYYFTWAAGGVNKIVAKTAAGLKTAINAECELEFYVYDTNGNLIKADGTTLDVTVEDEPRGSNINPSVVAVDEDGIVSVKFTPKKTGTYEFTVEAQNGKGKATFTVEAQEFGDVADMEVVLDGEQPAIVYDTNVNPDAVLDVTLIDEDGVEKDAVLSDLNFGSSNRAMVQVTSAGELEVLDEDFTGTVTITVIDPESGVSKELDVTVVGQPVSFNPVVNVVGKTASVELQYVDKNGDRTYSPDGGDLTLILPTGVSSEDIVDFDVVTGIASFNLVAAKAGEYTIIANSSIGITKSFKVAFEVPASEVVVVGAKNVTMFIGNSAYVQDGLAKVTDVAPFIKDNRTFVAIRPVADAFGCEIGWDEATQTVTLTRDDLTVTIVIGSSDIAVVKDGVTTTVTADVPAFIQNGRTVLPFRAIGNAFGVTVNYDAATQSVSYAQ